jgi:polyisoprenoid-binding protein YceI
MYLCLIPDEFNLTIKPIDMKISVLFMFVAAALWSCQGPSGERAVTGEATTSAIVAEDYETLAVNTERSTIEWIGARPASQHNGTVALKDGHLKVSNGDLIGGEFIIDLEQIVVVDITDPGRNARLKGHLESDDFFDVPNHPEAVFEITDVRRVENNENGLTHHITGNLLMRGVTRSVGFNATVDLAGDQVTAQSEQFLIDRTEWGVNYESPTVYANLVDRFILDDIALVVNLNASR